MYNKDRNNAIAQLTNFSSQRAQEVIYDWNRLFEYLLVKYHDGNIKKEKDGKFILEEGENPQVAFPEQPKYPERWYRMIIQDCGDNIKMH